MRSLGKDCAGRRRYAPFCSDAESSSRRRQYISWTQLCAFWTKSVTEALYETNLKNLYVIPSGKFPTNSTELLGNSRFEELIIALKKTFDYVIVDTPPLGSVVDAAVAAKRCDGSVLVISEGKDSRKMAKSVLEQLKAANSNFLGVAMNNVEVRKNSYYYKRYYNYYSHDKSMKED